MTDRKVSRRDLFRKGVEMVGAVALAPMVADRAPVVWNMPVSIGYNPLRMLKSARWAGAEILDAPPYWELIGRAAREALDEAALLTPLEVPALVLRYDDENAQATIALYAERLMADDPAQAAVIFRRLAEVAEAMAKDSPEDDDGGLKIPLDLLRR